MQLVVMAILLIFAGMFVDKWAGKLRFIRRRSAAQTIDIGGKRPAFFKLVRLSCFAGALYCVFATSYVFVDADEVGHMKKIYGFSELSGGRILAVNGEKGFQAKILRPGFHFEPLITVINDVEIKPMIEVPAGYYGRIVTADGRPLSDDAIMADPWDEKEFTKMLDASYFISPSKDGLARGQKGLQLSILKPGKYPLNLYLFRVEVCQKTSCIVYDRNGVQRVQAKKDTQVTQIRAGHVGVVRSNITEPSCLEKDGHVTITDQKGGKVSLSVPLVGVGCKGVWIDPKFPGAYFINKDAFEVTEINTQVQTWTYNGGYEKRFIDLEVDQNGQIKQSLRKELQRYDESKDAGKAIFAKVEGWDVPVEMRALVQITPQDAPFVVASVGGVHEAENRVITPIIRSEARNIIGGEITFLEPDGKGGTSRFTRSTRVLDLVEKRGVIEKQIETAIMDKSIHTGVTIKEVRIGETAIPPELLLARQREQLANQMSKAFEQEKRAQDQRIKTEQARAEADQQSVLVEAQIARQASEEYKKRRLNEGTADGDYLKKVAEGQERQAAVLGKDRVVMLQLADRILDTLKEKPEIVTNLKLPKTMVLGGGSGLEGAAAVVGGMFDSKTTPSKSN
ncbi:MAG: hypothetical protein GY804_13430 [Alphaproteobacteria bacterium]|nr:hypothetical protein [Alphaproteobacteria bacterium]